MNLISSVKIRPSGPVGAPILVIGESPGTDEVSYKQPFVGRSGELLRTTLSQAGFSVGMIDEVKNNLSKNINYPIRFVNLSNYQPAGNKFFHLESSSQLSEGLKELTEYIEQYKKEIKVIILLGEQPLEYITKRFGISKWRGSVILHNDIPCLPTFHPSFVLRVGSAYPVFSFDIQRAFKVYRHGYNKPTFNLSIDPSGLEFEEVLQEFVEAKEVAVDIETVKNTNKIISIAFASSRFRSICLPNNSDEIQPNIRRFCDSVFSNPNKVLIYHNGLFDVEILHNNQIDSPIHFDTMVAQHVLQPELEKGLDFITSIYTDIPYYKDRGRLALPENEKGWGRISHEDKLNIYEYNCLDTCATFWCYEEMSKEIKEDIDISHIFNYEMSMHEVSLHITRSGMLVDQERRDLLGKIILNRYAEEQAFLEAIVGYKINVGSNPAKRKLLYEDWKLPEKTNKDGKVTGDEDAIVSLISYAKDYAWSLKTQTKQLEWLKKVAGLQSILKIQGYRKLLSSYINITLHPDSRVRSVYKITGTETGRWSCSKYYDDTGFNAQTMPRETIEL